MTTALNKPVTRRCLVASDAGRRLVVTLMPGDVLGIRLSRGRQHFIIPLLSCYHYAVKMHVAARRAERSKKKR